MPRAGRKHSTQPRGAQNTATARHDEAPETPCQRLDKWLWFARFARTRSLASRLVEDGKVRINREKILKPAQSVRPGDVITAAVGGRVRVVRIMEAGARRGPAEEARGLYEDMTPPAEPSKTKSENMANTPSRTPGAGRPTKRERRKLDAARNHAGDQSHISE